MKLKHNLFFKKDGNIYSGKISSGAQAIIQALTEQWILSHFSYPWLFSHTLW